MKLKVGVRYIDDISERLEQGAYGKPRPIVHFISALPIAHVEIAADEGVEATVTIPLNTEEQERLNIVLQSIEARVRAQFGDGES